MVGMLGATIKWVSRIGFLAVFLFELANYLGVLHFSLDYTWLGLLITILGATIGVELSAYVMRRTIRVDMPWVAWPIAFGAVLFDVIGDVFSLYANVVWYDQLAHFLGTAAAAIIFLMFFRSLQEVKGWRYPPVLNFLLAFGLAMAMGVGYEIEEYLEDFFVASNRLGDGEDTANDLLLNTIGALSILASAWFMKIFHLRSTKGLTGHADEH
jgi:hypothetical protein